MSSSNSTGELLVQAGIGPVRASAWESIRDGQSMGVTVTLSKSFWDRQANQYGKSKCSLSLPDVAAAIEVLRDVQAQLLARSRELTKQDGLVTGPPRSEAPNETSTGQEF